MGEFSKTPAGAPVRPGGATFRGFEQGRGRRRALPLNGQIGAFLSRCRKESRRLAASTRLIQEGQACESCYRLISGGLAACADLQDHGGRVLTFFYPGELLLPAMPGGRWPFALRALGSCQVEAYPLEALREACEEDSALGYRFFELACRLLSERLAHAAALRTRSVDRRFALFLLDAARRVGALSDHGVALSLPMSRTDIASHLGLRTETLSRTIRRWRDEGLIELAGTRQVTITDLARVEALARGASLAASDTEDI